MGRPRVLLFAIGITAMVGVGVYSFRHTRSTVSGETENREDAAPETKPGSELSEVEPATMPVATLRPPPIAEDSPETLLMAELRRARATGQHQVAIQLAREGNRRFPNSDSAPERHSILVHALADDERRSEARGEAEFMVNHYPDSAFVREIEQFTGAHRHRNIRLNDAGEIEQY